MQLRGPLVGPDRWWYHTLLKGTVRETLASYGSVPESGPPFDQRVLEPTCPPRKTRERDPYSESSLEFVYKEGYAECHLFRFGLYGHLTLTQKEA